DSSEALFTAAWILINTSDGAEVEKAADVIRQYHLDRPDLDFLCQELERVRHRCVRGLLQAILEQNSAREVQAAACLALATMRKDEANYGAHKEAAAEAVRLFERLITEFGDVQRSESTLAQLAQPELYELRHLTIGRPAPEIVGEDLIGRQMRLSDYRGRVVVLTFWSAYPSGGGRPELSTIRRLLDDFPAVAALGVYCGEDLELAREIEQKLGWPSFRDGRSGPIATVWNNRGWPSVWILDSRGIIRHRGGYDRQAIEALLRE
ncbi:MAG: TlpA family protein disulfide reductase, partial [Verrucomicrobia bacterium]|nr:TlpA family protein disulfide reductase [Verrucomicrobiota bacterium]